MKRIPVWRLLPILPGLCLLPFLGRFAYTAYSAYTDTAISHYPNVLFLQQSLARFGQVPLWSPTILSGYPFAANPLSGLWYPPGWLALLFPQPQGINLVLMLHLVIAGLGMVAFLRAEELELVPATVGGLAFAALPRIAAHTASGHLTLVYAICWTPWLLWAVRRSLGRRWPVLPGVLLAAILLADPRWAAYAGLLWIAYRLWLSFRYRESRSYVAFARDAVSTLVLAVLLAAPLLLPLSEYTRLSTRAAMLPTDSLYLSLPLARLAGFFIPSLDGNTEWFVYPGALLTVSLLWYLFQPRTWRLRGFWLLVAILGVLLALGQNLPGGPLLARVPGFSLLRVPPRALLLTGFALCVLLACLLQDLSAPGGLRMRSAYFARLAVVGAAGLAVLAAAGVTLLSGEPPCNFWWGAGFLSAAAALLLLRDRGAITARAWVLAALALLLADSLGVAAQSMYFRAPAQVLAEGAPAAQWLTDQPGVFRVYSPDYSLPQQTAAVTGLQLANGVDPLQLANYADALSLSAGIPLDGYDVVLPPLQEDGSAGQPDAQALGRLNVFYVISRAQIRADGFVQVQRFGETRIYRNLSAWARAWVETSVGEVVPVDNLKLTPNVITLTAVGPGRLVLSEINYPGWVAEIDGQPADLDGDDLLRAIDLQAGEHDVEFNFRPRSVYIGLVLAVVGALLAIGITAAKWKDRHAKP